MTADPKRDEELERLAARIADDEPVNWQTLPEAGADDALSGMRELQQLVQGYRHMQLGGNRFTPRSSKFRFGGLTVIEPLGSGSQGDVWRAYDPLLDLQVALKLRKLESDTLSHQFLEEARRLARVRQANIVSVYGAAVHNRRAGLWMELIRGTSLAQLLEQGGPFSAEEIRGVGIDLSHALATVHRHGMVHGDVKCENVMREVSGRIVLMDFGAARELDGPQSQAVTGSLNYLAPEVLRGAPPSPGSDVYALGVLLFRLATGLYPYAAEDAAALIAAQDRGARVRLNTVRRGMPRTLVQAIERAIDPDPARRHSSTLAFAAALAQPQQRGFGWRGFAVAALLAGVVAGIVSLASTHWGSAGVPAWQTQAQFYRVDGRGSTALADGAAVALGDRLTLEFRSSRPAWVYVFDDDGSAQAAVLFPLFGMEPANPLAADTTFRLPGKSGNTAMTWQISRGAKNEAFVVIAADAPQPQLESAVVAWQRAGSDTAVATTRGALGLAPAPQDTNIENAALHEMLERVEQDAGVEHVRRWRYVFPHSGN